MVSLLSMTFGMQLAKLTCMQSLAALSCTSAYLHVGWSHFAQFTIAVVNKDPKKSKYSGEGSDRE